MTLLPDWKWILTRAWSAWAFYALGLLNFVEIAMAAGGEPLSAKMPIGVYQLLMVVIPALGIYFRVVAQKQAEELVGGGGGK
jgi:hypothetical protein